METTSMTRVSIPMSICERDALRALANAQLRDPREQARYMLRQALGLTCEEVQPQQMESHTSNVLADTGVAAS